MMKSHRYHLWAAVNALAVVLVSCASGGTSVGNVSQPGTPATPKRVIVGSLETPAVLLGELDSNADTVEEMVSAGLIRFTPVGDPAPQLAEAVPTLENGLWKLLSDGRMETTWKIKNGVHWHDGTAFTADDVLFAARLGLDKDLPDFGNAAYASIESIQAPDPQTVTVVWKEPFIEADVMFSYRVGMPLPKHILEESYLNRKDTFSQLAYFRQEFIHLGPYKLREFVTQERLVLQANTEYVLGRPKIDEIEVRFIPDSNTLMANVLSNALHLTIGHGLIPSQVMEGSVKWQEGKPAVQGQYMGSTLLSSQLLNPNPPILGNVQFRRALFHALDLQALQEAVTGPYGAITGWMLTPGAVEYKDIESSIVRYAYDPRRAAQLVEELGYTMDGEGRFRDSAGNQPAVPITEASGRTATALLTIIDYWGRIGLKGDLYSPPVGVVSAQATAERPGFQLLSATLSWSEMRHLTRFRGGSNIPTSQNNYRGSNISRYESPELTSLVDRFFRTIPHQGRIDLLKQIARQSTDNVVIMGLYHTANPVMIGNRVVNVTPTTNRAQAWDVHLWDVA